MDLIVTLIMGGLVGWLASLVMETDRQLGLMANILIGVIGSVLGNWLAGVLGVAVQGSPARWLVGFVGALLLIWVVRVLGGLGTAHSA